MRMRIWFSGQVGLMVGLALGWWPGTAHALINPQAQPRNYFEMHKNIGEAKVKGVETRETLRAELEIGAVHKGEFGAKTVALVSENRELLGDFLALAPGSNLVVFANKDRPRSAQNDGIYYAGGGKWYRFRVTEDPAVWEMIGDADEGKDRGGVEIMFGVFNGAVEQLGRMMADFARGTAYFPAIPFTRFTAEPVGKADGPVHGVGLHDLTGDGSLEIVAASPAGLRVWAGKGGKEWAEVTEKLGLKEVSGRSVDAADADGDGKTDLLVDGKLFRSGENGMLAAVEGALPGLEKVVSAAFVEIDGDGKPDVVVSREGGGLMVFLNRSEPGKPSFEDATEKLGLQAEEAGAGLTGFFEAGDWNGNGRMDLIYLAGPGFLLLNTEEGFKGEALAGEGEEPDYGAAAMGFLIEPGRMGAMVPNAETKVLLTSEGDDFLDVTRYGNEIQDDIPGLFAALVADLNADGLPDIFVSNRESGSPSFYVDNRGYGSFMMPDKYSQQPTFPSAMFNAQLTGLAAGDVTGDGALDLVAGGANGTVWLATNQTLADRPEQAEPSTLFDARKQIAARLVTVKFPVGPGVVGAKAELVNGEGRTVASGMIGGNIGVGNARPHRISLATREPGPHKLVVTFADGKKQEQAVDLSAEAPRHQVVTVGR